MSDPRNVWPVDGSTWLYDRVLTEPKLRQRFIDAGMVTTDGVAWKKRAIEGYFQEVTWYMEDLMVVKDMVAPQGRATEGFGIRYRNSGVGPHRSVFVSFGMVHIVADYHKGYGSSGRPKIIHRFMPREAGGLFVYLLWVVRPFVEILQTYHHDQVEFSPFLWEPRPEEGEDMIDELEEEIKDGTEERDGVEWDDKE